MFITDNLVKTADPAVAPVYEQGQIIPVIEPGMIMQKGRYKLLLQELHELSDVDDTYFDALYGTLIERYIRFVQAIPEQAGGSVFGLLNNGLVRGVMALQEFIAHSSAEQAEPIYRYAVFSAALLLNVSKVVTQQSIMVTDEAGEFIADWQPCWGDYICDKGEYYKYYTYATPYNRLDVSLTSTLAIEVMPEIGFHWISDDFTVFADWLDALLGNSVQGGRITRALEHVKLMDLDNAIRCLGVISLDVTDGMANQYGEDFLQWLKNGISDESISVNESDSLVHVVDHGVLVETQLFKQFVDMTNLPVNHNVVHVQFGNLLGIVKKGGSDMLNAQYFSEAVDGGAKFTSALATNQGKRHEGVVVSGDKAVLFVNTAQQLSKSAVLKGGQSSLLSLPSLNKAAKQANLARSQ